MNSIDWLSLFLWLKPTSSEQRQQNLYLIEKRIVKTIEISLLLYLLKERSLARTSVKDNYQNVFGN